LFDLVGEFSCGTVVAIKNYSRSVPAGADVGTHEIIVPSS